MAKLAEVRTVSRVFVANPAEPPPPPPQYPRPQTPAAVAPQLPSMGVMARGLMAAGMASAARLRKGQPLMRSAEDQAACLAICTGDATRPKCEHWILESQRCAVCGCFANWAKRLAAKSCPRGKWPPLTGEPPHGETHL